ncbi:hypothetical protein Tco_0111273 [Tanacetum coccineum]
MSNQTNELKNMMASFFQMNTASSSGSGSLPSNTVANPRGDLKAITTQSGISYDGPQIPPLPKVVEREPEVTKDMVQPSTENIQPLVVQIQAPNDELVVAPKPKPSIPYTLRANKQKLHEKDDNLASNFGTNKLPVIIAKDLKEDEKVRLLMVLKSHKRAIAWKISDIKGIDPQFCTHKILMEDDSKLAIQHQRRVNPNIHEVIKKEVIKLLDARLICLISDSPWVSLVHYVPKKGGITVIENEDNELILTRLVTGWRVCIDYQKLNDATRKDHFPLQFMDQMLERLAGNKFYCFLDGFSRYFQILIDPQDQEKTTFTCPYGTFAYRCMPFGLCSGHVPKVHDGHFPRHDRGNNGGLYGRFLGLRGFFLLMPLPFRQNAQTVRRH